MRHAAFRWTVGIATAAGWCLLAGTASAQTSVANTTAATVGETVAGLYDLVSFAGGQLPAWDRVRARFLPEAVIVLRTSRTALTAFTLEGFIKDFIEFYERPFTRGGVTVVPKASGFTEKVVRMRVWEYGEMAHVLVLYEAHITGSPAAPQQGVDSWLLIRRDGRWLIAAATNEIVTADLPVPAELRGK